MKRLMLAATAFLCVGTLWADSYTIPVASGTPTYINVDGRRVNADADFRQIIGVGSSTSTAIAPVDNITGLTVNLGTTTFAVPVATITVQAIVDPVSVKQSGNWTIVNSSITVQGTVTANAGTNLNTSNVTIGTFPDNEPFNFAQYNGVAPGFTNPVHVSSHSIAMARDVVCDSAGCYAITCSTFQVATAGWFNVISTQTAKSIYVTNYDINAGSATIVQLTSSQDLTKPVAGWRSFGSSTLPGGMVSTMAPWGVLKPTTSGDGLFLNSGTAVQLGGVFCWYAK